MMLRLISPAVIEGKRYEVGDVVDVTSAAPWLIAQGIAIEERRTAPVPPPVAPKSVPDAPNED